MKRLPFAFLICLFFAAMSITAAFSYADNTPVAYKAKPVFEKLTGLKCVIGGVMGDRLSAITESWLLPAPLANPMIINMFRTRDRERDKVGIPWDKDAWGDLLPWSGEFAGKHLISAELVWRETGNPELKKSIDSFVKELISTQDTDGYMGPFPKAMRFDNSKNWDFWGQYHVIQGLLLYFDDTGDKAALDAACKAADLMSKTLMPQKIVLNEMNYGIIHCMTNLYRHTGNVSYLKTAEWVVDSWGQPNSLNYINLALEGKTVVEYPAHRWESAHSWQGIAEMYMVTGDEKYLKAFRHIWENVLQGDRHNTGGWTSGEGVQNNPFHQGAIETCCTVAWIAMTTDMLRLTGDSKIADELELSTFNGSIGGMVPSGRWWTYNTPMDGAKRAAIHDITFQQRAGSPELNCCSVNAPRGLGMIRDWAVMSAPDGYAINWYGPGAFRVPVNGGGTMLLSQKTYYPSDGRISITIGLDKPCATTLKFRIPSWSAKTTATINGQPLKAVPGTYLELKREWRDGDTLELAFDMTPHFWTGERECVEKISVYYGPLLLAWDQRFNTGEPENIPAFDPEGMTLSSVAVDEYPVPIAAFRVKAKNGAEVVLCDFANAGMTGTLYRSWLPLGGAAVKAGNGLPVWTGR